jgi:hypothetical protein
LDAEIRPRGKVGTLKKEHELMSCRAGYAAAHAGPLRQQ